MDRSGACAADRAYYPPVPQVCRSRLDAARPPWCASAGNGRCSAQACKVRATPHIRTQAAVLVAMGGSDPMDLTRLAAHALASLERDFHVRFVIGPGVKNGAGTGEGDRGTVADVRDDRRGGRSFHALRRKRYGALRLRRHGL